MNSLERDMKKSYFLESDQESDHEILLYTIKIELFLETKF